MAHGGWSPAPALSYVVPAGRSGQLLLCVLAGALLGGLLTGYIDARGAAAQQSAQLLIQVCRHTGPPRHPEGPPVHSCKQQGRL